MNVQLIHVDSIVVSRERLRDADEKAVIDRKNSIAQFGQLTPIIVDDAGEGKWNLIAGLHRWLAVRALKWTHIAAVLRDSLNELEARQLELEENVQRLDMTWLDKAKAIAEIDKLRKVVDPNWTARLTAQVAKVDAADVSRASSVVRAVELWPELADSKSLHQAMTRAKDKARQVYRVEDVKASPELYASIEERIWHGDSTKRIREVADGSVDFVLTDPPFGIDYDERKADTTGSTSTYKDNEELYLGILGMAPELFRVIRDNGTLIWFLGISWYERAKVAFRAAGFNVDEIPIIWDRSDGKCFTSRPDRWFARGFDIALHAIKGDAKLVQRGKNNILRIPPVENSDRELVVERPVELYQELIRRCTVEGELVADFFVGSGSCPAAATSLKRRYFGIEQDAERRAVAIKKIRAHTPT